jgi:hypothetical protein
MQKNFYTSLSTLTPNTGGINVIGVVTHLGEVKKTTTGGEFIVCRVCIHFDEPRKELCRSVKIVDPSNFDAEADFGLITGFNVICFTAKHPGWLPSPKMHDVLILRSVKVSIPLCCRLGFFVFAFRLFSAFSLTDRLIALRKFRSPNSMEVSMQSFIRKSFNGPSSTPTMEYIMAIKGTHQIQISEMVLAIHLHRSTTFDNMRNSHTVVGLWIGGRPLSPSCKRN